MNYDHPELASRLASEYVLGTLRGPARIRFQRLLLTRPLLRSEVMRWEQRLGSWGTLLEVDAELPEAVWTGIRSRIDKAPAAVPVVAPRRGWRWPAALVAGLMVVMLVGRMLPTREISSAPVAVLKTANGEPRWIVSMTHDQLRLASLKGMPAFPADSSTELWVLPTHGKTPRSLGVIRLDEGQASLPLSDAQRALLASAAALAVSLEPPGGSPTGSPTGPVVLTASLPPTAIKAAERT